MWNHTESTTEEAWGMQRQFVQSIQGVSRLMLEASEPGEQAWKQRIGSAVELARWGPSSSSLPADMPPHSSMLLGATQQVPAPIGCEESSPAVELPISASISHPELGDIRIRANGGHRGLNSAFGRYERFRLRGQGAMGVVFAAYDRLLRREVGLKVLVHTAGDSTDESPRVLAEARVMARFCHPNIVNIYDIVGFGRYVAIVMELIDGPSLGHWLTLRKRSWREVSSVFIQAGTGLMAAHDAGIVHGDIKPHNLIIGRDGRVRVADFGLARTSSTKLPSLRHDPAMIVGTPLYMAPEQRKGEPLDHRADQFAWCAALHHSIYGRPPFSGRTDAAIQHEKLSGQIDFPMSAHSSPGALPALLRRGMSPRPCERFPSMRALLDEMERIAADCAAGQGTHSEQHSGRLCERFVDYDRFARLWTDSPEFTNGPGCAWMS